jgi:hypothetical protein
VRVPGTQLIAHPVLTSVMRSASASRPPSPALLLVAAALAPPFPPGLPDPLPPPPLPVSLLAADLPASCVADDAGAVHDIHLPVSLWRCSAASSLRIVPAALWRLSCGREW